MVLGFLFFFCHRENKYLLIAFLSRIWKGNTFALLKEGIFIKEMCELSWDFNRINDNYMYKAVTRLRIYTISSQGIIPFLATLIAWLRKGGWCVTLNS